VERFIPDFYLPGQDLYIELTTMKSNLVTRKNKKALRLRELYPEITIKVFYGRDYRKPLLKFGFGKMDKKITQVNEIAFESFLESVNFPLTSESQFSLHLPELNLLTSKT
jgi:hypothetical protein|tara:strand:- start:246 stop:575 length:330 start_codon:yes stop_codon:yes gene_type:complete